MARPRGQFDKNKKSLHGLIQFLSSNGKPCWATTKYLSKKMGVSIRQTNRYLAALKKERKIKTESTLHFSNNHIKVGFYERRTITCRYINHFQKKNSVPMPKYTQEIVEEKPVTTGGYKKQLERVNKAKSQYIEKVTEGLTPEQIQELASHNYDVDAWFRAVERKFSPEYIQQEWADLRYELMHKEEIEAERKAKEEEEQKKKDAMKLTPDEETEWQRIQEQWAKEVAEGKYAYIDKEIEEMKKKGIF